jgi:hypothetical protein
LIMPMMLKTSVSPRATKMYIPAAESAFNELCAQTDISNFFLY